MRQILPNAGRKYLRFLSFDSTRENIRNIQRVVTNYTETQYGSCNGIGVRHAILSIERLGSSPKAKNSVDSAKAKTKKSAIAARAGSTRTVMSLLNFV
jgi:hypothetical protein